MPRNYGTTVQNNFSKGLITEATGLSFPEDACTDTFNCEFDPAGIVTRRLGFDFEQSFSSDILSRDNSVIVSYLWKNVAGEGDITFVVTQIGDTLHFYRVGDEDSLSASKHADTIDLTDFAPTGVTTVASIECQFASGNGLLFVTNANLDSFYVEYSPSGDTITGTEINIQVRDFEGDTGDTLSTTARTTTTLASLNAKHRYNLENQGWISATLTSWDNTRTDMPSNADVSWYFKNSSNEFDFSTVANRAIGNSPAPKGHFIYNLYDFDRSTNVSGATDKEIATARVSTCAFYAGRVFYSGLNTLDSNSKIFFSQIVEARDQYGKCYQVNDPTSEQLFDLLPSDGGVIDLLEAGTIIKMIPVLNALIIFATNGVWAITGSQGIGFTATDYSINRLSAIPCLSAASFVEAEGTPYWWNLDGIHTLTIDPQTNAFRVVEITKNTVKSLFDDVPLDSKIYARGSYDPFTQIIQWGYNSDSAVAFEDKYVFDRFVRLNLRSGAWNQWSVGTDLVKIHGIVNVVGLGGEVGANQVVDGADTVVDGADNVVVFQAGAENLSAKNKYYVSYVDGSDTKFTFGETLNSTCIDWETFDDTGESYDSYFVTGFALRGEAIKKFQPMYITFYTKNDIDTSFLVRGQWNFSVAADSGKWSTSQLVEHTADDFSYKPKRVKIRGNGLACQFRVSNNSTDQFQIIGWSALDGVNRWV